MNRICKTAALLLSVLCLVPAFTGCAGNAKQNLNIAEEDMPYGATMRENSTSFAVPMTYDRRFFDEEQVAAVANLIAAIQNSDSAQYEAATFPFYAQYQMNEVYRLGSVDAVVRRLHDMIGNNTSDDYQFNMVLINDLATNTEAGELAVICEMLSDCYDGEGAFMDTVEHAWDLTVEWQISFNNDADHAMVSDQHLFLFQTADGYFCLM